MKTRSFYERWFLKRIKTRPTISKRILFNQVTDRIRRYAEKYSGDRLKVLDVGCGAGHLVARLLRERNMIVTGVDITNKTLNALRQLMPAATFKRLDFSRPQHHKE